MRKWRVIRDFYLGESDRIKARNPNEDNFMLYEGTIIYEAENTDRVVINGKVYHFRIGTVFTRFCVLEETLPESVTGDTMPGGVLPADLVWKGPSDLTTIIAGKRYQTPDRFFEESLVVAIRGLIVADENVDGFTIIDDQTFEMKETYTKPKDWIMCGYVKKSS